jgi:hypothetical protein
MFVSASMDPLVNNSHMHLGMSPDVQPNGFGDAASAFYMDTPRSFAVTTSMMGYDFELPEQLDLCVCVCVCVCAHFLSRVAVSSMNHSCVSLCYLIAQLGVKSLEVCCCCCCCC